MGLTDKLKKATGQATKVVAENEEKLDSAIDKAAEFADKKTKGKYADKITKATDSAKKGIDKIAAKGDAESGPTSSDGPSTPQGPSTSHDPGPDEQQGSGSTP